MKKLFKDANDKLLIAFMIMMIVLSTAVFAYATNRVTKEMDSKGSMGTSETINFEGQYLTWEDLKQKYDILCCYHGGNDSHLMGRAAATLEAGGKTTTTTDSGKNIGELTKSDEGNQTALTVKGSTDSQTPYTEEAYYAESWAWYEATEIVVTSPDNSYILAEMIAEVDPEDRFKVFYDNGYSTIQYAWWVTDDNRGTNHSTLNALYYEAEAFYSYIKQIAKSIDVKSFVDTNYKFTDKDGTVHEGTVPAPELEYEPKYNEDANQDGKVEKDDDGNPTGADKVTATFDTTTNTWTIGPFSIDYVEESFQLSDLGEDFEGTGVDENGDTLVDDQGNPIIITGNSQTPQNQREPIQFAGITNAQLYTNLGEVPFAIKEDEEGIENPIQEVEGAKWRFNFLKDEREVTDTYRFPHSNEVFYIELDYIPGVTKIANLHFDFKYMNAGGRYEKLEGTYFEQTWTPDSEVAETCPGPTGNETSCSHGKSSSHDVKWNYWLDLTSMEEHTSQLLAYGVVGARWYNYTDLDLDEPKEEWNYKIIKKVVDEQGNPVESKDKFVFKVYANGELLDTVKVPANKTFVSQTYELEMGEEPPTVEVKEAFEGDVAKNYKLLSIEKGEEGKSFVFTATNQASIKSGRLSIEKQFTDRALEQLDELKKLEFQFKVYIDGKLYKGNGTDDKGIIRIHAGEKWTSDEIKWTGDAPTYKVTEVNLPENVILYDMQNETGRLIEGETAVPVIAINEVDDKEEGTLIIEKKLEEGTPSSSQQFTIKVKVGNEEFPITLKAGQRWSRVFTWKKGEQPPAYQVEEINVPEGWKNSRTENPAGQLQSDKVADPAVVTVWNEADENKGSITLTKTAAPEHQNLEFHFKLYIDEKLQVIDGKTTPEGIIKIHPGEVWESGDITWKGAAPKYKVEEVDIPEGVEYYTITNGEGILNKNTPTVVDAINDDWDSADIIIKKVLEEGTIAGSEEFSFNVRVGEKNYPVTLKAGDTWKQTFTWKKGEKGPDYEVTEVNIPEGWELIEITPSSKGTLEKGSTVDLICKNGTIEKEGKISIQKEGTSDLQGRSFDFKVTIDGKPYTGSGASEDGIVKVKVGEKWTSDSIKWKGAAPKYKVEEVNLPEDVEVKDISNASGSLVEGEVPVLVVAKNGTIMETGELVVKKVLDGNIASSAEFTFKIKVGDKEFTKILKAGQSWKEKFSWKPGEAPTYEVTEVDIPDGYKLVKIEGGSGTLAKDKTITVTAINEGSEKSGQISVTKKIVTDDKIGVDSNVSFPFTVRITGTFECEGESIVNSTKVFTKTLSPDETWTLPEVKWYGDAPKYSVSEGELPEGWRLKNISNESGTLQESETINVVCTNEYKLTKEYDLTMSMSGVVWEDKALKPEDKNTPDSKPNGLCDDSEERIENVEVLIWRVLYSGQNEVGRVLATGYEENSDTEITYPIYTSADGIWRAPRMSVPGLSDEEKAQGITRADYDVEFYYEGQTYEPTEFLATAGDTTIKNKANKFKALDDKAHANTIRNTFNRDSMAIDDEEERNAFNEKFTTITGDSPIGDDEITYGYAIGTNGETTDLEYKGYSVSNTTGQTRKVSELQTLQNGFIREQFKMPARTSTGGLTFPFDERYHLEYVDKYINKIEGGAVHKYHYSATYPYLLNINLGLVRRDNAELALTKDVHSANVVVNQKLMHYKFNEYVDFEDEEYQDYLNLQFTLADANISYKLDLYESDYYYRAQVYASNPELNSDLQRFYDDLKQTTSNISDELDLDVFLTYKIDVYNDSDSYEAQVKTITDYFDEDLELVTQTVNRYVQPANAEEIKTEETEIASAGYVVPYTYTDGKFTPGSKQALVNVKVDETPISSSAEVTDENGNVTKEDKKYYKAEITLVDGDNKALRMKAGEKLSVYLTFRVRTDESPFGPGANAEARTYTRLGTKANVAEIASYTTYNADDGKIAGKIDKDSAPNNVDIANKNEKEWYEDDADSAPIITLNLYENNTRNMNGMAWEDAETESYGEDGYYQRIGDGLYNEADGDRKIGNLNTQIVEKIRVKQADGTYKEHDFIWPTNTPYSFLNGSTIADTTGFSSVTLTSNRDENKGEYEFKNIPAGNYVVRFVYGQFGQKLTEAEQPEIVRDTTADETRTYDADNLREPAVYNGQDFKVSKYQADYENNNSSEGYITDEWYHFESCKYNDAGEVENHNSDAIDNEARRLRVIAYSQTLDNAITTVLATANDPNADHKDLYDNTYMIADTAKINLSIENMQKLEKIKDAAGNAISGQEIKNDLNTNYTQGQSTVNGNKGTLASLEAYAYVVDAIDIGIEERSNTEIVLDKEIESITVKTNTDNTILSAIYDISYEYELEKDDNGEYTGKTTYKPVIKLNKEKSFGTENLLAQNKEENKEDGTGTQNFRYIYYDDTIAQALNLEVVYKFTALNLGEVDRVAAFVKNSDVDKILAKAEEIEKQVYSYDASTKKLTNINHPEIGKFVGSMYYVGKNDKYNQADNLVVETKIRQLIDYVDNDVVFDANSNKGRNASWRNVSVDELAADRVIAPELTASGQLVDDKNVLYVTEQRNNLVLSVDSEKDEEQLTNKEFVAPLVPYTASTENTVYAAKDASLGNHSEIRMTMTRSIDSQISDDDLSYDNIGEIVKFYNTVGKRDIKTIAGNVDPKLGEFTASLEERDASATELITFTPPTGLDTNKALTVQMLIVVVAALTILAVGIVIIKKTVLK